MAGITIPDRDGDEPEHFAKQQAEIARQVEAKMAERLDRELRHLINKEGK